MLSGLFIQALGLGAVLGASLSDPVEDVWRGVGCSGSYDGVSGVGYASLVFACIQLFTLICISKIAIEYGGSGILSKLSGIGQNASDNTNGETADGIEMAANNPTSAMLESLSAATD